MDKTEYGGPFILADWPSDSVLRLSLNRPPLNSSSHTVFNTRAFTAGLDLKEDGLELTGADSARSGLLLREHVLEFQAAISKIEDCERAVIVTIHGVCYGLGIDIITACDIRLCDSSTKFSIKEVDAGIAADIGTLQRLPRKLVTILCCENWRLRRVPKSPIATLGTKHLLNYSIDHSVSEGLNYTALWSANALQANDVRDSISAALSSSSHNLHSKPVFNRLGKL
ncbi:hypothetical protein H4Q26_014979 [Puccinia striiformis f. sp. tritici PST-130]|nr:hypothetical protein H4Q26_014979 [Puccinia striiformis f. sp. tritici PST-130]